MDSTKPTPDGPAPPGFGISRDLRQLKTHGAASAAELREFLDQMRGRRPQEVLGLIAGSHLVRSIVVATLGAVVLLVGGSVVPWWLSRHSGDSAAAKAESPPPATAAKPAEAKPQEKPATEPPAPTANARPGPADAEKAIKVMGLGETKAADPKTNPLEKTLDNLLDKIE